MEIIYNKLVRDNIPEIIKNSGGLAFTRILSDEEYLDALHKKLNEEIAEYFESGSASELCDVLEVVYAIAEARGISRGDLEKCRAEKSAANGAFDNKIYLEKVEC